MKSVCVCPVIIKGHPNASKSHILQRSEMRTGSAQGGNQGVHQGMCMITRCACTEHPLDPHQT